jgi:glutamate--cysteine ligase
VRRWPAEARRDLRDAAAREGLRARTPDGRTVAELAADLVEAARLGLCRQGACGQTGEDERIWLGPFAERAASARSPADDALDAFRSGGPAALSAHLRIAG